MILGLLALFVRLPRQLVGVSSGGVVVADRTLPPVSGGRVWVPPPAPETLTYLGRPQPAPHAGCVACGTGHVCVCPQPVLDDVGDLCCLTCFGWVVGHEIREQVVA